MKFGQLNLIKLAIAGSIAATATGCSVFMAANQPSAKNVELFNQGTLRAQLIAEFGAPANTKKNPDGTACDIFTFTQGYSGGAKATRAIAHGLADVFTLGLWEVIGTPTEAILSGDNVSYQACYNKDDVVTKITLLTPGNDGKGRPDVGQTYDPTQSPAQKQELQPTSPPSTVESKQTEQTIITVRGSTREKLIELEALRKEGLINESDFQEKRKSILNQM